MTNVSLRRNFSWTFAANVIYALCQWLMLVVLAQTGSPAMVGEFGLALAITAPIVLFANLGLRQIQATDAKKRFPFGDYYGLRLVMLFIAALVVALVVLGSGFGLQTAAVVMAMAVAKFAESLSDLYYGVLQFREQMDRIAVSMIARGLLSVAAFSVALLISDSVLWAVMALAAVWTLVALINDRTNASKALRQEQSSSDRNPMQPSFERGKMITLFLLALPLGLAIMLISLGTNIPRYFIEGYLGRHSLGIFVALTYPLVASTTVVIALGQSASPRMAKAFAAGDRAGFAGLLKKLVAVGIGMGVIGIIGSLLLGEPVLELLYGPEYASFVDVFVWLMVGSAISDIGGFMGFALTAAGVLRTQPFLLVVSCVTCVILAFLWVPDRGLLGAAWAYTGSQAVHLLLAALFVGRSVRRLSDGAGAPVGASV